MPVVLWNQFHGCALPWRERASQVTVDGRPPLWMVGIRTSFKTFVSAQPSGSGLQYSIVYTKKDLGTDDLSTRFLLQVDADGRASLKTYFCRWLASYERYGGMVSADTEVLSDNTRYKLLLAEDGGVHFRTEFNQHFLSATDHRGLSAGSSRASTQETFTLVNGVTGEDIDVRELLGQAADVHLGSGRARPGEKEITEASGEVEPLSEEQVANVVSKLPVRKTLKALKEAPHTVQISVIALMAVVVVAYALCLCVTAPCQAPKVPDRLELGGQAEDRTLSQVSTTSTTALLSGDPRYSNLCSLDDEPSTLEMGKLAMRSRRQPSKDMPPFTEEAASE